MFGLRWSVIFGMQFRLLVFVLATVSGFRSSSRYGLDVRSFRMRAPAATPAEDMNWDSKAAPKLDFNEDYYRVVEGDPGDTPQELKRAYYKTVFKYHPDK